MRFRVELGLVRIRFAGHRRGTDDTGNSGVGVVEQHAIANLHSITHEVARLVVPDTVPWFDVDALQVVDRERIGFGLHQPVAAVSCHWVANRRKSWVSDSVQRSEERRVGKEGVSTGRSRWAPYN